MAGRRLLGGRGQGLPILQSTPMTAALIILLLVFAYGEARHDFYAIQWHGPIDHAGGLLWRLFIAGILWGIAFAADLTAHDNYWRGLWMAMMGWAAFTMFFRACLNWMRGKALTYVSPSNWYDWQWIRLADSGAFSRKQWQEAWTVYQDHIDVRHAGLLAYAFEALVFLAGLTMILRGHLP